jgi:hypothetical protein
MIGVHMLKLLFRPKTKPATEPGFYQGKHYTTYIEQVKALKHADKLDKAERLLLALVTVVESENQTQQHGVAPWYYEQLAIIYRGRKDYTAEVAILERCQQQLYNRGGALFAERLETARALLTKAT